MKTIKWAAFFATVLASLSAQAQTYYITDKVLVGVYEEANGESNLLTTLPSGTPLEVLERNGSFTRVRSPDGSSGWIEGSYMIEHKPAQLVVLELTDKQKQSDEQLALAQAELRAVQEQVNKLKLASKKTDQTDEIKSLTKQRKEVGEKLDRVRNQLSDEKKKLANAENTIAQLEAQITDLKEATPAAGNEAPQQLNPDTERLLAENRELTATLDRVREALALPATPAPGVVENGGMQVKITWLWLSIILFLVIGFVAGMKWLDWRNLQRHGGFRI
jgi:SH3 domain protein